MRTSTGWYLLLALAAGAAGGAAATLLARGNQRHAARIEHKADVKNWENEGGNLKPNA
jgi:hypothetical protein